MKNPTALSDSGAFFTAVRASFGSLNQSQVDGYQALLQAFGVAGWPIAFAAYGLATAYHETNATMQPVREAYWLSEDWRRTHLRYYPWYGRGFPQLTWERNYRAADAALGLNGALIADPDLAMRLDIATRIMVWGMETGAFTGKKLADYLPLSGGADVHAYANARRIINGLDRAGKIADEAEEFEGALHLGDWR